MADAPPHSWLANTSGDLSLNVCRVEAVDRELEVSVSSLDKLLLSTAAKFSSELSDVSVLAAALATVPLTTPEER